MITNQSNKTDRGDGIPALEKLCLELEVTAESMDDLIHDLLSVSASAINNSGLGEQLRFIALNGKTAELEKRFSEFGHDIDLKTYIDSRGCEALATSLEVLGIECSDLDDLVHDCEGGNASVVNNAGLTEQVKALAERIGFNETEKLIRSRFGSAASGVKP